MAGVLDIYGYRDSEVGLVSSTSQQTAKDNEQDSRISKNYNDNVIQQTEINENTSVNDIQRQEINELYNLIGQWISGTTVVHAIDTNFMVEANSTATSYEVGLKASYNNQPVTLTKCVITKYVNDEDGVVILENTGISSATTTSEIVGNKEQYVLEVVPDAYIAFETRSELTRYICYVGANSATTITSEDVNTFRKYVSDGKKMKINESTFIGQYMWFIIPKSLNVEIITSDGVSFVISSVIQTMSNSLGEFKCYRSKKMLDSNDWEIIIETSEM